MPYSRRNACVIITPLLWLIWNVNNVLASNGKRKNIFLKLLYQLLIEDQNGNISTENVI